MTMADLQDIDGVGPARAESLEEAGYDDVDTLAEADHEQLAEDADIPEDRALEFVVQAQDMVVEEVAEEVSEQEEEVEEEDEGPLPGELADEDSVDVEEEVEEEPPRPTSGTYSVTVDLPSDIHYDAYMNALFNAQRRAHGSRQDTIDAVEQVLNEARYNGGTVEHELTEFELNTLHATVSQQVTDYKGHNMIDHMDALREVLQQVNDVRQAELF